MNQILSTSLIKKNNRKNWFKVQFLISIFIVIFLLIFVFIYYQDLQKKEQLSNNLMNNYDIFKLYNNNSLSEDKTIKESINGLFGIIEIPKLNLHYPIFSELSDELLKIAPCKFYGKTPDKFGNLCIAGHNYHNSSFFSKLSSLVKNDEIYIYDNSENQYKYYVYDIYEVEASDLSPVFVYNKKEKILTLFTCDNSGTNRIIVKSKQ